MHSKLVVQLADALGDGEVHEKTHGWSDGVGCRGDAGRRTPPQQQQIGLLWLRGVTTAASALTSVVHSVGQRNSNDATAHLMPFSRLPFNYVSVGGVSKPSRTSAAPTLTR